MCVACCFPHTFLAVEAEHFVIISVCDHSITKQLQVVRQLKSVLAIKLTSCLAPACC